LSIVERVPLSIEPTPENAAYLKTKQDRMGHVFDQSDITAKGPQQ
jgi:3,4-dihydroxy 2-butanone 4-phosphate synthase/GTP cyclohydrolase II